MNKYWFAGTVAYKIVFSRDLDIKRLQNTVLSDVYYWSLNNSNEQKSFELFLYQSISGFC